MLRKSLNKYIEHINEYFDETKIPKYEKDGIYPSELIMFLILCKFVFKVDVIIESGVKYGYSTQFLTNFFEGNIYSIDKNLIPSTKLKFEKNKNVHIVEGDSYTEIENILKNIGSNIRVACLIDGPKGIHAINLCKKLITHKNILLFGIHDVAKEFNENRIELIYNEFKNCIITSEEVLLYNKLRYLDERYIKNVDTKSLRRFSNGPGLAIINNN